MREQKMRPKAAVGGPKVETEEEVLAKPPSTEAALEKARAASDAAKEAARLEAESFRRKEERRRSSGCWC